MNSPENPVDLPTYTVNFDAPDEPDTEREWLLTNGLGGFAMGTVSGVNTRRYHGLLTAATRPPVQRVNALTAIVDSLHVDGEVHPLSGHQFAGPDDQIVTHPEAWRNLVKFDKTATGCRWQYRAGGVAIERSLRLRRRRDVAVIEYRFSPAEGRALSGREIRLRVRPLVALRDFHALRQEAEQAPWHVASEAATVAIRTAGSPTLKIAADAGTFEEKLEWWYRFRYQVETDRGQDDTEDLLSPGCFDYELPAAEGGLRIVAAVEPFDWDELEVDDQRGPHLRKLVSHVTGATETEESARREALASLAIASDDFVVERRMDDQSFATILAGYPWFADWGRDTMIALPGLLLATGRHEEARRTLLTFAGAIRGGLVPNRFDDYGGEPHYNTVDASLWFVHAATQYRQVSGDEAAWGDQLDAACREVLAAYRDGTDFGIHMDADGLIAAGDRDTQLTWMDAKRDGVAFTPRHGKAVEINALWHNALVAMSQATGDRDFAAEIKKLSGRCGTAFNGTFWCEDIGYLIDHVNESCIDYAMRPNQLLAVSLPHSPIAKKRQLSVVRHVRERLLTPYGLRTLPVDDSQYHGQCAGSMFERDEAYHQGTIWPWLIGPFVEGWLRANRFDHKSRQYAASVIAPLIDELARHSLGQLHEVFDGDPPHAPRGCIAQAWSVAELLRVALLVE